MANDTYPPKQGQAPQDDGDFDPLTAALQPPKNESSADRKRREAREAEALKRSQEIDAQIEAERVELTKRRANQIRVLLLGQSESGKTTVLKQFAIGHCRTVFDAERLAWRPVIYLNIIRSIRTILTVLHSSGSLPDHDPDHVPAPGGQLSRISSTSSFASLRLGSQASHHSLPPGVEFLKLEEIAERLKPLAIAEAILTARLACPDDEFFGTATLPDNDTDVTADGDRTPTGFPPSMPLDTAFHEKEIYVQSSSLWRKALLRFRTDSMASVEPEEERSDDQGPLLRRLQIEMLMLWHHPETQRVLKERKILMKESSGFFLDDLERIAVRGYVPSTDDILRARLKTIGVNESSFVMDYGTDRGREWVFHDVGGARNQRHKWTQFFDDINLIIFMAPLSAFNQQLTEDRRVNRLKDSLQLWEYICSSKLLAKVPIVMFMNKLDLLRYKLNHGVQFNKYLTSYRGPNDAERVLRYLQEKFARIREKKSAPERKKGSIWFYGTSAVDRSSTAVVIQTLRLTVVEKNLVTMGLDGLLK